VRRATLAPDLDEHLAELDARLGPPSGAVRRRRTPVARGVAP